LSFTSGSIQYSAIDSSKDSFPSDANRKIMSAVMVLVREATL